MTTVVMITGASAGFGIALVEKFIDNHHVIALARRKDKLDALKQRYGNALTALPADLCNTESIDNALSMLKKDRITVDVLVNNAGLALGLDPADKANISDWQTMIATNVSGLVYLTHALLPDMVAKGFGHIINIGSVAGNYAYPGGNIYGATKAFVKQFSRGLRADLIGRGVRVTNIEPGLCGDTEFSYVRFKGDQEKADKLYQNVAYLRPEDIANAVFWAYQQPKHVNIESIEIMPQAQSFAALNVVRDAH